MTWQSDVTPEQWAEWQEFARKASKSKKMFTTLGAEDYAASAIERLLEQEQRPANIEAWLQKTINNQYIDRFRKIEARGGVSHREWSDERWEQEMISHAFGSPSVIVAMKDHVDQVLKVLSEKEKELLILAAAGFDNHQIANYANYKNNKIVATRLAQIAEKVRNSIDKITGSSNSG